MYALAADTGCLYWTFKADAQVRTAISVGLAGNTMAIYFGDRKAFAYAVDATTGALLWKTRVDEHPAARITGAPTLADGRLYVPTSSIGGSAGGKSGLRVLHVSRQRLRAERLDRRGDLEVVHDP